jgi:hypothetical protein
MAEWLEEFSPRSGPIRLEDQLTDTEYTVRAELPGRDPKKTYTLVSSAGS